MKNKANRALKKLNRGELLEIILKLKKNEAALEQKLTEAQGQLEKREILMKNAGSIAEAALMLNDVFGTAQRAADTYIASVRLNYAQMQEKCAQAEYDRQQLLKRTQLEADKILEAARLRGTNVLEAAKKQCGSGKKPCGRP